MDNPSAEPDEGYAEGLSLDHHHGSDDDFRQLLGLFREWIDLNTRSAEHHDEKPRAWTVEEWREGMDREYQSALNRQQAADDFNAANEGVTIKISYHSGVYIRYSFQDDGGSLIGEHRAQQA